MTGPKFGRPACSLTHRGLLLSLCGFRPASRVPETLGIAGPGERIFRARAQQHRAEDLPVLQSQWGKVARQSEDGVQLARGEQLSTPRLNPAVASIRLTLGAVSILHVMVSSP